MLEGVPIGVANLSATGVLAFIFVMLVVALIKGWVVVKIHYDKMEKAKEHWRDTADKNAETIRVMAETALENRVVGETVVKVMSAIQEQNRSTGGSA